MTEVYVDIAAASIDSNGGSGGSGSDTPPAAEAVRALRYLADAGIRVVLVTANGVRPARELEDVAAEVVEAPPTRPRAPAWYLTNDMARCGGASALLRTILIGGLQPSGAIRRCDATARDVQAAVMEILAAVAMPPGATGVQG